MATFAVAVDAFKGCFRNWRLWLLQFFVNPLLFGLFTLWLLIPLANAFHVALNIFVVVLLVAAFLLLHAGTLNYFYSQDANETAPLRSAFAVAFRNLLAVALGAAVLYLLFFLASSASAYTDAFPPYLRSIMPAFLRKQVGLSTIQGFFDALMFALRWILVPGLVLPFLASASHFGFRGFGRRGFAAWKHTVLSLSYWALLILAALVGVLATQKIMDLTPDFRTSTFAQERTSLILRASASYLLGLFAWMLTCSLVGRRREKVLNAASGVSGNPGA
jgi:hypothetical protein